MKFHFDSICGETYRNCQNKRILSPGIVLASAECRKDMRKAEIITECKIDQVGFAIAICIPKRFRRVRRPVLSTGAAARLQAYALVLEKGRIRAGVRCDQNQTAPGLVSLGWPRRLVII